MKLSIVVPVYREEQNVPEFVRRMVPIAESITTDFEIIFAHDPSTDRTQQVIREQREKDRRVKLIEFSRRFGQPMATLAGMAHASGDAVVVMDVDLQDPPELVPAMIEKFLEGYDVVYAQRRNRDGETLVKRIVAKVGYTLINGISDVDIPPNTGDFRLMSRRVVNEVLSLKESHGFLRGMVALVGFKQTCVRFDRPARFAGRTSYNRFVGSILIGMNGVVCFSNTLLSLATLFGFAVAGVSFLMAIAYLFMKLAGAPFPLGNPTVVIIVLFLGGVQLISVGVLGEYIGRIYDEVKQRPRYVIDETAGFLEDEAQRPVQAAAGSRECSA